MPKMQDFVDAIKGKDPQAINKTLAAMAKDRREEAALETAMQKCSIRVKNGEILDSEFWACTNSEFDLEKQRPSRIMTPLTPQGP